MTKKLSIFAVLAFAFFFAASPALAGLDATIVWNENGAMVENEVTTQANTGMNYADGSYGGDGGRGGDIRNGYLHRPHPGPFPGPVVTNGVENGEYEGGNVEESTTGDGGAGGNAGNGGTVVTGNARADSMINNRVNWNDTDVEACPCDDTVVVDSDGDEVELPDGHPPVPIRGVLVVNRNMAGLGNGATTQANTGDNETSGSYAGYGGNGGDIMNRGGDVDESGTGTGAMGGNSAEGGLVQTGMSEARTDVLNRVNTNLTRIHRTPAL